MSIFKATFKNFVKEQITAREDLLSSDPSRDIKLQQYVSANSPWVRMVSFVDYPSLGNFKLAEDYVLYGGTLYNRRDAQGNLTGTALRYGIYANNEMRKGASYGSTLGDREYGLRPMPGIESVSVRSLGAYGSLRETTIKYYAWDLTQLQNLNILYMKPGYPVLLEWGWSLYLDDRRSISKDFTLINPFNTGLTLDTLYTKIYSNTEKYKGNYDASIGFIKNYNYTLLQNGGFECTTTLISMGEVIESLKINGVSSKLDITPTNSDDEFVTLLTTVSNFKYADGSLDPFISSGGTLGILRQYNNPNIPNNYLNPITDLPYSKFKEILDSCPIEPIVYTFGTVGDTKQLPGGDIRYTKFISLAFFVHILNNCSNIFLSKGSTLVKIEIPLGLPGDIGNGYCVSSKNAVSINNDVCFISNNSAVLVDPVFGFSPKVLPDKIIREYLEFDSNLGKIGHIYLNIGHLISVYKEIHQNNKGSVDLRPYLQKILEDVQYSLGSINNFDIATIDNKGIIIDKHYVENYADSDKNNKFELNIMGIRTTVRDHKVVSKIFSEQSTMVAIAAQDRENVAALQTSTQVALNKNIYNRLYPNTSNRQTNSQEDDRQIVYKNIQTLIFFVRQYIIPGKRPVYSEVTLSALNSYLNQLLVIADRGTDYKGIVPLSLEVKMDGISGVTIGEIFRINANVLPSEYRDKDVGFIVTGIGQELNRSEWTTTLTTQFCLLNQKEKYLESLRKADEFYQGLTAFYEAQKVGISRAIKYYNVLLGFLEDFFADRYVIKDVRGNAKLDYKAGVPHEQKAMERAIESFDVDNGNIDIIKLNIGQLTKDGWVSNRNSLNKFEISSTLEQSDYTEVLLSKYLSWDELTTPVTEFDFITEYELLPIKQNVNSYLNYIITSNLYYKQMSDNSEEIKTTFNNTYNTLIRAYVTGEGATSTNANRLKTTVLGSPAYNLPAATSDFDVKAPVFPVNFLNPDCLDPQTKKIIPEKLFLQNTFKINLDIIKDK